MAGDALAPVLFALRTGLNISSLLLIGIALHAAIGVVERETLKRWRSLTIGLALATSTLAFARLLLLNLQMGDASTILDPDLTAIGWMALGPSSLAFLVGAAGVVLGVALGQRIILGGGAIIVTAGFALTGHTQALSEPGVMPYVVALHAAAGGFWVAAPLTLAPTAMVSDDVALARLKRFSAAAMAAVPLLFIAGLWLAWVLAGGAAGLLGTAYGWLLMAKLSAAMAALGVGAFNQKVVTAKVATDPPAGRRWLRRTLTAEAVLFVFAILAVSAATTLTGAGDTPAAE